MENIAEHNPQRGESIEQQVKPPENDEYRYEP